VAAEAWRVADQRPPHGAFTLGAVLMTGHDLRRQGRERLCGGRLLSLGGFAHQTLSVTVITMASDLFRRDEVATVAGMAGTMGNLGLLIFSLLIGGLVTTIGYTRSSSPWACSTWSPRSCCGRWSKTAPGPMPLVT
jgi:MFS family permease